MALPGRGVWLVERPGFCHPVFGRQPNHLQHWAPRHWVLPADHQGIQICVDQRRDDSALARDIATALSDGALRVHVGGFLDDVEPAWTTKTPHYAAEDLCDAERRWASLEAVLVRARDAKAQILVLPELTVTPPLRDRVAKWLARNNDTLLLVLPGSFHVGPPDARRNEAWILDRYGDEIVRQQKLRPMRTDDVLEDVLGASIVRLVATPLGLLGIGICLDFCEEEPPFNDIWHRLGLGLMLVPSMSNRATGNAHERRAAAIDRAHATITAAAIQPTDDDRADWRFGFVCGHQESEDQRCVRWLPEGAGADFTCTLTLGPVRSINRLQIPTD